MESKIRYVLKHRETGLYYSRIAQVTGKLFDAWRFYSEDEAKVWMEVSHYKPDHPEEYSLIAVRQMIEEVELHGTDGAQLSEEVSRRYASGQIHSENGIQ
jgi:hypothetical protein